MTIMKDIFKSHFPSHKGEVGLLDAEGNPIEDLGIGEPEYCGETECPAQRSLELLTEMNHNLAHRVLPEVEREVLNADKAIRDLEVTHELEGVAQDLEAQGLESLAIQVRGVIDNIAENPLRAMYVDIGNESFFSAVGSVIKRIWDAVIGFIKAAIKFVLGWFFRATPEAEKVAKDAEDPKIVTVFTKLVEQNKEASVSGELTTLLRLPPNASVSEISQRMGTYGEMSIGIDKLIGSVGSSFNYNVGKKYNDILDLVLGDAGSFNSISLERSVKDYNNGLESFNDDFLQDNDLWSRIDDKKYKSRIGDFESIGNGGVRSIGGMTPDQYPGGVGFYGVVLGDSFRLSNGVSEPLDMNPNPVIIKSNERRVFFEGWSLFKRGFRSLVHQTDVFNMKKLPNFVEDFEKNTDRSIKAGQIVGLLKGLPDDRAVYQRYMVILALAGNLGEKNSDIYFVGPNPDIVGYLNRLTKDVLSYKHGKDLFALDFKKITAGRDQEELLTAINMTYQKYEKFHVNGQDAFIALDEIIRNRYLAMVRSISVEVPKILAPVYAETTKTMSAITKILKNAGEDI